MAGKIPDVFGVFDGTAVAAGLGFFFDDEVILVVGKIGKGEARKTSADDEVGGRIIHIYDVLYQMF